MRKKCLTCRNKPARGKYCRTCESRKYREKNKIRACYQNLKDNCKRRGKVFDITYEQFEEFCAKTDYIAGKGKTKDSYSLDRICNEDGYTYDNLQVLTLAENARKHTKKLHYDWQNKTAFVVGVNSNIQITIPDNQSPF